MPPIDGSGITADRREREVIVERVSRFAAAGAKPPQQVASPAGQGDIRAGQFAASRTATKNRVAGSRVTGEKSRNQSVATSFQPALEEFFAGGHLARAVRCPSHLGASEQLRLMSSTSGPVLPTGLASFSDTGILEHAIRGLCLPTAL